MAQGNITYNLRHAACFPRANNWFPISIDALSRRFWARVDRRGDTECWPWLGETDVRGRGKLAIGDGCTRRVTAPRIAWALHHSAPRHDQVVCHSCDNPACVNPTHLFIGRQAANIHDSVQKGRKNCWGHQKLNAEQVLALRAEYAVGGVTQKTLGRKYGIARNTVSGIVRGTTWAHLPLQGPLQSPSPYPEQPDRHFDIAGELGEV